MSKKRERKKVVAKRKTKRADFFKEPTEAQKRQVVKDFAENSGLIVMPSLIEALEYQNITDTPEFVSARDKLIKWFSSYIEKTVSKAGPTNYLPDLMVTFIIPLDFKVPLPEEYISGALWGSNYVSELSFVTTFSKILPIGDAGVKISYLLVSMCDNETARLIKTNERHNIEKAFEKAISIANAVISGLQAVPGTHDHNMHDLTAISLNTVLKWFTYKRDAEQISEIHTMEDLDRTFTDIIISAPISGGHLERFKINHTWKTFTDNKVFKLISLFNSAVNARCFGRDDQAIISADTFVEYSLGYIYCELRIANGDDSKEVIEEFNKITKPGIAAIWDKMAPLLGFTDKESLKSDVLFDKYDAYCRKKRNHLHHHFMTDSYGEIDSMFAVYFCGEMIRRICELAINSRPEKTSLIIAEMSTLGDSTLFFKTLTKECVKAHPAFAPIIS